jgi:hypothetical protein
MPPVERRCIWCGSSEHIKEVRFNKQDRATVSFCSDACEASARRFLEFDVKYSRSFYLLEAILGLACLTLVLARLVSYAGIVAVGIGILFLPFPFLAAVLGGITYIKRSILVTRVLGLLVVVAGLVVVFLKPF